MNDLVSICITSYNYGRFIRDAIDSALAQTYRCIEVVISDNASSDETHDVLRQYASDERVRVFINSENVGMCKNHNLAIERSRGSYIVVLSADDVLFPRHVERLLQRIHDVHDPVSIASGCGIELDERLQARRSTVIHGKIPIAYSHRDDFGGLLFNYYQSAPAKLIARSVYEQIGPFDERMVTAFDVEHAIRIAAADVPSAFLPEVLVGTRVHDGQGGHRSFERRNALFHDKMCIVEHALRPEHAWRVEGFETQIVSSFEMDMRMLTDDGSLPLSTDQTDRFATMKSAMAMLSAQTPQWPEHEPTLSVIILSEGYAALLQATLEHLAAQYQERIEVHIVQVSGFDLSHWVQRFDSRYRVRVTQIRNATSYGAAFRLGLELVRGEYIAYLREGQRIGQELYRDSIELMRLHDAQVFILPQHAVDDALRVHMPAEGREHRFGAPAEEVQKVGEHTFSRVVHRRAILRCPTIYDHSYYDRMASLDESNFVELVARTFRALLQSPAT